VTKCKKKRKKKIVKILFSPVGTCTCQSEAAAEEEKRGKEKER
jgi:hypothetical protein